MGKETNIPDSRVAPHGTSASDNGAKLPQVQVQELVPAPKRRQPWVVPVVLLLVVVIAAVSVSGLMSSSRHQSTNDAYIEGRIIRISPRVSGPVIALHVDDNDWVKAGEVLLEIDPADYQAKVDQAIAAVSAAQSGVEQAKAAVLRAEAGIGEAEASLHAAATEARRRASDYRRYEAMGTDGVSAQQLETALHASEAANDQQEAAAKKVVAVRAELNVAKTNVVTAEAQVAAGQAQLRFAQLQLQYTKVIAPESGRVTKKNVELGNFVGTAQPLFSIVPDDRWVIANFKEVQLDRMRVGQPVEIRVDSYPEKPLRARVQSLQCGTGARFELLPPENATGNWVKVVQRLPVKITFDPGQDAVQLLAQGMSVEVTVDTRKTDGPTTETR
jgi:membrane fusion protein (multidrug efflux system)